MAAVPNAPGSLDFAAGSHFLPKGSVKKVPATESRGYDRAQSPSFSGFGGWHLFPPKGGATAPARGISDSSRWRWPVPLPGVYIRHSTREGGAMTIDPANYVRPGNAAKIAGVTRAFIVRLCNDGRIGCFRVCNSWFVSRTDAEKYRTDTPGKVPPKAQVAPPRKQAPVDPTPVCDDEHGRGAGRMRPPAHEPGSQSQPGARGLDRRPMDRPAVGREGLGSPEVRSAANPPAPQDPRDASQPAEAPAGRQQAEAEAQAPAGVRGRAGCL